MVKSNITIHNTSCPSLSWDFTEFLSDAACPLRFSLFMGIGQRVNIIQEDNSNVVILLALFLCVGVQRRDLWRVRLWPIPVKYCIEWKIACHSGHLTRKNTSQYFYISHYQRKCSNGITNSFRTLPLLLQNKSQTCARSQVLRKKIQRAMYTTD